MNLCLKTYVVRYRRYLIGLVLALVFISTHAAEQPPLSRGMALLTDGRMAPEMILPNMDDELVDLKDFRGKTVIINFWATWCPPCRREMPSMERLFQRLNKDKFSVLAVNIGEDFDTVFAFTGTLSLQPTFPMLFDPDSTTLEQWKVRGLPTTYVVGPDGRITHRAIGGREFDNDEIIRQLNTVGAN